jgi:hypothetical protein
MNQKHIFLIILLIASVIVSGCGQSSEVRWYKIDGVELVNERIQFKFSLPQPEKGDPTNEELTQLALDWDSSFFAGVNINEFTYLRDIPGGEDFRAYLFGLGQGYENFAINLVAFEVIGSIPTR